MCFERVFQQVGECMALIIRQCWPQEWAAQIKRLRPECPHRISGFQHPGSKSFQPMAAEERGPLGPGRTRFRKRISLHLAMSIAQVVKRYGKMLG